MNPIITISGTPGSGKSTIAKNILPLLKAERIYTGGLWRDMAKEKNMTMKEFHEYAANNHQVDRDLDEKVAKEARKLSERSTVVVEGRVQFHFLPESIKIFVKADIAETAKRVWKEMHDSKEGVRETESHIKTLAEMEGEQKRRRATDIDRYKDIYKIDYTDESQYDFVLDTTDIDARQATQKVMDFIDKELK